MHYHKKLKVDNKKVINVTTSKNLSHYAGHEYTETHHKSAWACKLARHLAT